jgi:hypothetical protein
METASHTARFSPRLGALAVALAVAVAILGLAAARANAAFGVESFDGEVTRNAAGDPAVQAGSHPYRAQVTVRFNSHQSSGITLPDGSFKDIHTSLPPGLVGNPHAVPRCTMREFNTFPLGTPLCPNSTALGVARLETPSSGTGRLFAPVYNLVPEPGKPARFGFRVVSANIFIEPAVRTGGDYGLDLNISDASQGLAVFGTELTLWGVPADPAHDTERGQCLDFENGPTGAECSAEGAPSKPFITNPSSCSGPLATKLEVNSWEEPDVFREASFLSHDPEGSPVGIEGCDQLGFEPTFSVHVDPPRAESSSSLGVDIHLPRDEEADHLATADLKKAVVTLPAGMSVNPAAANGLGACPAAQIGIHGPGSPTCPDSSRIGGAEISSPLLDDPLSGSIFLARQGENPFGSLLAVYLVAAADGVTVKLPGRIDADQSTGQLTATFDEAPQLPFEDVHLRFFGGAHGVLLTPSACGAYSARASLAPWSGTAPVDRSDSFSIGSGPSGGACSGGPFAPRFGAGSADPTAGAYTSFALNVSREDGMPRLTGVDAKLPAGLLAKLSGIPYCPEAALGSIPGTAGTGAAQVAKPSCPASSRVGTVTVGAGAGANPFYLSTGRVYLAGPYKGAPYSLALVTPVLAGPFDLGSVVVRAALRVSPETAQVDVLSDPIPTILSGIPLDLRDVRVNLDRSQFVVNPTGCDPTAVAGTVRGSGGAAAAVSDRFQVGSCAALGLRPRLSLRLEGGTARAAYPALRATLKTRPGDANLKRVSVTLPRSEILAQNHIGTVCTRVQFAAGACPAASVYGFARAVTPLLDAPLEGPVYLRSSSHRLPDLVAALHGQIDIDLAGRIDTSRGRLRDSFEAIPDAPLTRFELTMKGGRKSLLQNSRNLCAYTYRASVAIDGQNGRTADRAPRLRADCGG